MKIPDSIKVAGITYSIRYNKPHAENLNAWGITQHSQQLITLDPEQADDRMAQTFLHELLHVAFDTCGLEYLLPKEGVTEEQIVDCMSKALLPILQDNDINFRREA